MYGILLPVVGIASLVSAFMESKTTGLYKTLGVYGRVRAYLFVDFLLAGVVIIISGFDPSLIGESGGFSPIGLLFSLLLGLVLIALSVWMYLSARAKCPAQYRGKLLLSMFISGFGVSAKILVFFLPFVWKLSVPQNEGYTGLH